MPYTCDKCGACCRHLIIEIGPIDIAREPRFLALEPFRTDGFVPDFTEDEAEEYLLVGPLVPGFEAGAMLACGPEFPCMMLGQDNLCTIYPTRPNCCVAMRAGSDQCQMARVSAGLMPLHPDPEA
jgi:Fe-S-cluster containining protein